MIEIANICLSIFNTMVLIFIVVCTIIVVKDRKKLYRRKRRPIFILIQLLTLSIFVVVTDPLYLFLKIWGDKQTSFIYDIIFIWILIPIVSFGVTAFIIRIWLLYFDMQLNHIIKNQNWIKIIDPSLESKNWYLKKTHQRRFGNDGKYLLYFDIIDTIIEKILWHLCLSIHYSVAAGLVFVLVTIKVKQFII